MKIITDFPRKVIEHADAGIIMSDGCRLSARIWIPEGAAENPTGVILEHLPYRKRDGTIVRDQLTHPWFAGHGYVCIRTDMRGNGESGGHMDDEYTAQELQDAVEVINWAAAQPWCNGNVGMMGISWGGFNGLQVAALNPEPLKAVISLCSTVDRYADDIHYKGGCLLGENFGWSSNMLAYSSRPPDRELTGDGWKDMWLDRLAKLEFGLSTWLRHQHRDAYWEHGSVCENYAGIRAAVLSLGGWHDGYRNTISHLVENLTSPVKGIVGPWNHKYPHYAGPAPAIGFLQEAKRWWDQWLLDLDTGVETDPAYRAYVMDSLKPKRWFDERPGRWIAEQTWPSSNITPVRLYLQAGDGQNAGRQSGQLKAAQPEIFTAALKSPQDCGSAAGEYFPFAFGDELPDEQSGDDAKSLCFDSAAFEQATDIVGAPDVRLRLASDRPQANIAVRLLDLRPDGTSALITYGVLNLCHRDSHAEPAPIPPGKAFGIRLSLDHVAYRLPGGHRLRVALSTAYFPLIWPSPESATLTLSGGELVLPVRPENKGLQNKEAEWTFEEPESAPPWRHVNQRKEAYTRTVDKQQDGITVTHVCCDFGENRDGEHGLISGGRVDEKWSIHADDPLSAACTTVWEKTGGRPGHMWRTVCESDMRCDRQFFYIRANLKAFENGEVVFEKRFDDKIARNLV